MTWAQTTSTGQSTGLAVRVRVQGLPVDFVSLPAMVKTTPDGSGRTRRVGLSISGAKISQKVDIAKSTVQASGLTFKIADGPGDIETSPTALFTSEWAETWMAPGTLTDSDATLVVLSTSGFPSTGRVWIDTECMEYVGVSTTVIDGVTYGTFDVTGGRGALGTLAQFHYSAGVASEGRNLRFPSVTSGPVTIAGKRVELYVYGRGDSLQGDGTQIWTGIITRDPRWSAGAWAFSADPMSRKLEQELGGDLGSCQPRGIHFPGEPVAAFPTDAGDLPTFILEVRRNAFSGSAPTSIPISFLSSSTAIAGYVYFPHPDEVSASNPHGGKFESQQDFCDAVQRQLDVIQAGWGTTIRCVPFGDHYYFELTSGASPDGIAISVTEYLSTEGAFVNRTEPEFGSNWIGDNPSRLTTPVVEQDANETLYCFPQFPDGNVDRGAVPRGLVQLSTWGTIADLSGDTAQTIYLDGTITPTSDMTQVEIEWPDGVVHYGIAGFDSLLRSLTFERAAAEGFDHWQRVFTRGSLPTIKLGRVYEWDAVVPLGTYNLLKAIEEDCPEFANLGIMPVIEPADWDGDLSGGWLAQYLDTTIGGVAAPQLATKRRYVSFKAQKLVDLITPDLQLLGAYLAFDSIGRLTIRRLRPALSTEPPSLRIDRNTLLKGTWPTYEKSPYGSLNTWVVQDGYDPVEDKWTGVPHVVRDVSAYGRDPTPRALSVKPKSIYTGPAITYEDAEACSLPLLGLYGDPYAIVRLFVPLLGFDTSTLGSTVTISSSLLPGLGVRGMEAVGSVISREIDLYGGAIELEILVTLAGAVGYAPSALVTGQLVSGSTWDITLSSDYFRAGDSAANHFLVGDNVKVYPFDSAPGLGVERTGAVVSGGSGNTVRVTLGGAAWVPGGGEWVLAISGNETANMKRYAYLADEDGRIDYAVVNPDRSAFKFSTSG